MYPICYHSDIENFTKLHADLISTFDIITQIIKIVNPFFIFLVNLLFFYKIKAIPIIVFGIALVVYLQQLHFLSQHELASGHPIHRFPFFLAL